MNMTPEDLLDTDDMTIREMAEERKILERILERGDEDGTYINVTTRINVLRDAIKAKIKQN